MSMLLASLRAADKRKNLRREQIIALAPDLEYLDGRTKQCHKDECDISKIMARFDITGTISHVNKYEGLYADFSDFDFMAQEQRLRAGNEIFDALPAELRNEFHGDTQAFFNFVNDPANKDDLLEKLPALAAPGQQLPRPKNAAIIPDPVNEPEPKKDPPTDPPPAS